MPPYPGPPQPRKQTKQRAGCTQALASATNPKITQQSCPERLGQESPDSSVHRQVPSRLKLAWISLFSLNSRPVVHRRSLNSVDFLCNVLHSSDGRKTNLPENNRGASRSNTPVLLGGAHSETVLVIS